ncbi:hypothetical protein [Chitinilyticum piscinae]|uniref:Uncharacterized protein n=1 Tax=Chitinilyticum piscinae TaxID=2866724 RepID=A0A8J7FMG8_9NEIS|nr:hypothetical protein [Chitinilyticum piscinae]MBE9610707.1 hypothetical protein [Chitinilyticum piscinae]
MQFKPRNPYALAARQRSAGAHEQSERAQRRSARQQLRQCALEELEDDSLQGGRQSARERLQK